MLFSSKWLGLLRDFSCKEPCQESGLLESLKRPRSRSRFQSPSKRHLLLLCLTLIGYGMGRWRRDQRDQELGLPRPIFNQQEDYYFHPALPARELTNPPRPLPYNVPSDPNIYSKLASIQSPATPLFIPFTRNHIMLEETVLSYIAAGWPRSDIIIIDNTGTMDANLKGLLSQNNTFYLNYSLLRERYGVSILRTPTLLSFSQLQNFMISTAINKGWAFYFWGHQDVVVLSDETATPFKGFYENILHSLSRLSATMGPETGEDRWAVTFYGFDWLALLNVDALVSVGAWDTFIPYYFSDCDWYERVHMAGLKRNIDKVGLIYDLSMHLDEPERMLFGSEGDASHVNSTRFHELTKELEALGNLVDRPEPERNRARWHNEVHGGWGEPWTYDPEGFMRAWWLANDHGKQIFELKWRLEKGDCNLMSSDTMRQEDAWSV